MLRQVHRTLEQGWPPGLTVLTGDDAYHLDLSQEALLRALVPEEEGEYSLTVLGGSEGRVDVGTAVAAARSMGMFSRRRVVLVREGARMDGDPAVLEAYAATPPEGSFLVIRAPTLDLRRKLHKALAAAGTTLRFEAAATGPREAGQEIRALGKELGLDLPGPVVAFYLESCAGDLYRVRSELDKLRAFLGSNREVRVRLEDVRTVASGTAVLSGWEVADAILDRDTSGALRALRLLLGSGVDPLPLLGGLASRARSMLQAKAMDATGANPRTIVDGARAWYFKDRLFAGLGRYDLEELQAFPARLLAADVSLKTGADEPGAVLEHLVRALTGASDREGATP